MSSIQEARKLVNVINSGKYDLEEMKVFYQVAADMVEIHKLKHRLGLLEAGLFEGHRASFWFELAEIDKEDMGFVASTLKNRVHILEEELKEKEEAEKKAEEEAAEKE